MTTDWPTRRNQLAKDLMIQLYQERLFRTWLRDRPQGWELVSGAWSPFYITMREVPSRPALFQSVVKSLGELLKNEVPTANKLLGLASTGIPLAAAVGFAGSIPMTFNRKIPNVRGLADLEREVTRYGGHRLVEGQFEAGDQVALVDDVVNLFDSKEVAIQQLRFELRQRGIDKVDVAAVVTLVDRGRDARLRAEAFGVPLHSLLTLREDGLETLRGIASDQEIDVIRDYVNNYERYQDPKIQEKLRNAAASSAR